MYVPLWVGCMQPSCTLKNFLIANRILSGLKGLLRVCLLSCHSLRHLCCAYISHSCVFVCIHDKIGRQWKCQLHISTLLSVTHRSRRNLFIAWEVILLTCQWLAIACVPNHDAIAESPVKRTAASHLATLIMILVSERNSQCSPQYTLFGVFR